MAVRGPSNALNGGGLRRGHDQLIVESESLGNSGVDSYDHAEADTDILDATAFARACKPVSGSMEPAARDALAARMAMCVGVEVLSVDAGVRVASEGVGNEVAQGGLHDEYGRVGAQQERYVGSVGFERSGRSQYRGQYCCRLQGMSAGVRAE